MNIKAGMYLTNARRQQGLFKEIFLRLRDGKITSEDWHGHGREKWVPIVPYNYDFVDSAGAKRYRKQYPVQCAWALTA